MHIYWQLQNRGIVLGKIDVETPAHTVLKKTPLYEVCIWRYPQFVLLAYVCASVPLGVRAWTACVCGHVRG